MLLPNTFLIGAPKCGTTSIADALSENHKVCLTNPKETLYFWKDYHKSILGFGKRHYKHYDDEPIRLEASSHNAAIKYSADRIHELVPSAKIMLSIREPIERAYSHWFMAKNYMPGKIHDSFEREMLRNIQTFSYFNTETEVDIIPYVDPKGAILKSIIIEQGLYATFYDRYARIFGRDNICVILFDELKNGEAEWRIEEFLDLPTHSLTIGQSNIHKGGYPESNKLHDLYEKYHVVRQMVELYVPQIYQMSAITGVNLISLWGYDKL